jgi:hypothetical protein
MSGKEYYIKHKDDNCHINTKKYFRTPEMVHKFLSTLKRIDKRPMDRSFEQTVRSILRERPISKNPLDWMVWKNRLLQHFEPIANLPDDLCELATDASLPSSSYAALPLPLQSPPPFEPHTTDKLISNNPANISAAPIGYPIEIELWKEVFSPITSRLDRRIANLLHTITTTREIIPYLVPCKKIYTKTFSTTRTTNHDDTYVYIITGGFAYRIIGAYLRHLQPDLPRIEDILTKGLDYDVNFLGINLESFPTPIPFRVLQSFCEQIYTVFHSTWNKQHSVTKNGRSYELQFIKPSPCIGENRKYIINYDYIYIHDRLLLSTSMYAIGEEILSIEYRITLCLQIKTASESYCYTTHIFEIHFLKENNSYIPQYEIQTFPWFPAFNVEHILTSIGSHKPIHSIPITVKEALYRFQIGTQIYQVPNLHALLLQSMNTMVIRIASDDHRTHKARQDYARIYTILRMLETLPEEPILKKKDIQSIYTTLQSITMPLNWKTLSDAKKHEMIKLYKDSLHNSSKRESLPWKTTRVKTTFVDKTTQKIKQITQEYYKGPYEECRINPKEEDPLLWELGHAKFMIRKQILDELIEKDLPEIRRKSCDGTAPVKRRTVKKRSTGHKTRKHRSL